MKKRYNIFLLAIIVIASIVRIFWISKVPPSLSWDEASVGFDAYSILTTGKDQWGQHLPIVFKSFGEFKYPIHVYFTAFLIQFFGYNTFSVRLGSAVLGVVNIVFLFYIIKHLTRDKGIAIIAALFLAISPWHIQFSRVNWETNYALFIFFLGLLLFFKGLEKKRIFLPFAFFLFGLDLITYNAAKIFIPLFVLVLTTVYFQELIKTRLLLTTSLIIFAFFIFINLQNPDLSGLARFKQVNFDSEKVRATYLYKLSGRQKLGIGELVFQNYISHFSPSFLFISGDKNPRHSIQTIGELYLYEILTLPLGIWYLIKSKKRSAFIIIAWALIGILPASIATEAPHASRAMFAIVILPVISASGFLLLLKIFTNWNYRRPFICACILILIATTFSFLNKYFFIYPKQYSEDWQYGYKEIFAAHDEEITEANKVIVSDEYGQPYIFALFYQQIDPISFRDTVIYNPPDKWGFSTVSSFGKFEFKKVDSKDFQEGNLIFATPNEPNDNSNPAGEIRFLNGKTAFFVYKI